MTIIHRMLLFLLYVFSNQTIHVLTCCEDLSNFQPVQSNLNSFRVFVDDVCAKTTDFNLSPGCFGRDIIQKCTKWLQIGVHGLKIGQISAKCRCASFWVRKMQTNTNIREKHNALRSYTGHTKIGKNKLSDIIQWFVDYFN